MPAFTIITRVAYKPVHTHLTYTGASLAVLIERQKERLAEDEMILSIEILQDDKVVWDSTAEPTKSQIMMAAHGDKPMFSIKLPTDKFNVTDYMGLPMVMDTNLLEDMILIDNKPTPTGRISKPDPQFQEFKWPKNKSILDMDDDHLRGASVEEFARQYLCTPKPEPKEEIRKSVRPKARYKMTMPAIVPASTLRDIPEHKGKFVAIGYMLDRDGNKHTSETRTSLLVKVDIEAGYIETLNSIYEIV